VTRSDRHAVAEADLDQPLGEWDPRDDALRLGVENRTIVGTREASVQAQRDPARAPRAIAVCIDRTTAPLRGAPDRLSMGASTLALECTPGGGRRICTPLRGSCAPVMPESVIRAKIPRPRLKNLHTEGPSL